MFDLLCFARVFSGSGLRLDSLDLFGDVAVGKLFQEFFGSVDDDVREPGELGDLDSVALIGTSLYDLSKKDDVVAFFLDCDTVVADVVYFSLELSELVIVRGKQCLCAEELFVADVFEDSPCDGQPVVSRCSPSDLVQNEE